MAKHNIIIRHIEVLSFMTNLCLRSLDKTLKPIKLDSPLSKADSFADELSQDQSCATCPD